MFSTNNTHSSIHVGNLWLQLKCTKSFSDLSKALLFLSNHMIHISSRGTTSHSMHLFFLLLNAQLNIVSFIVLSITHSSLNHLKIFHHKQEFIQQCRRRFTSSPDSLHMKHQLTQVIFLFLKFSSTPTQV